MSKTTKFKNQKEFYPRIALSIGLGVSSFLTFGCTTPANNPTNVATPQAGPSLENKEINPPCFPSPTSPTIQIEEEGSGNISQIAKRIISEHLGVDEMILSKNSSFVDNLCADSLDAVELIMAFEEEFGIEIPDEEAEKVTTVQEAIDLINFKIKF